MQTPEIKPVAEKMHDDFFGINNKQRYDICLIMRRYSASENAHLMTSNQTLLDEVNRLDGENESLRKQLGNVHPSHRGFTP